MQKNKWKTFVVAVYVTETGGVYVFTTTEKSFAGTLRRHRNRENIGVANLLDSEEPVHLYILETVDLQEHHVLSRRNAWLWVLKEYGYRVLEDQWESVERYWDERDNVVYEEVSTVDIKSIFMPEKDLLNRYRLCEIPKSPVVKIDMSKEEYEAYQVAARSVHQSVSEYCKVLLNQSTPEWVDILEVQRYQQTTMGLANSVKALVDAWQMNKVVSFDEVSELMPGILALRKDVDELERRIFQLLEEWQR